MKQKDEALAQLEQEDADGRVLILTDTVKQTGIFIEEKESAAAYERELAEQYRKEAEDESKPAADRALA